MGTLPEVPKCVIIVAPHTSWVDFLLGLLVRKLVQKEVHFIGKKSLFKKPYGWYFRWLGGTPVDRSKSHNLVSAIARIFEDREEFRLALAPEGTRKKVEKWKTGFYYIAMEAQVPIVMVAFDYGKKQVKISPAVTPTGDMEQDFQHYLEFFQGVVGKVPEYT